MVQKSIQGQESDVHAYSCLPLENDQTGGILGTHAGVDRGIGTLIAAKQASQPETQGPHGVRWLHNQQNSQSAMETRHHDPLKEPVQSRRMHLQH